MKAKDDIIRRARKDQKEARAAGAAASRPNTAQLRGKMASVRTMGKTSAQDPAAAPFDTDDEAAGRPAKRGAVLTAMEHEGSPSAQRATTLQISRWPVWIAAVLLAIVVLWIALT